VIHIVTLQLHCQSEVAAYDLREEDRGVSAEGGREIARESKEALEKGRERDLSCFDNEG
jgi:hypothetical protein